MKQNQMPGLREGNGSPISLLTLLKESIWTVFRNETSLECLVTSGNLSVSWGREVLSVTVN